MTKVEEDSQGKFRIFSKLGAGYSSSRSKGEIVSNAYGCFPVLHENGMPVVNSGYEFSIHVRGSIDNDVTLLNVQEVVLEAMTATVNAIMEGKLL